MVTWYCKVEWKHSTVDRYNFINSSPNKSKKRNGADTGEIIRCTQSTSLHVALRGDAKGQTCDDHHILIAGSIR